ncbi:MAG TPA: hypothetical protein VK631_10460 [Solirubrobacteraceae bacterium]|nr:hypothetical protein [Solirubrobacteraceae bacterium]
MPDIISQFAFPPRLTSTGELALIEQGSGSEITQRIHVLVLTPPGWLDSLPDFGLGDQAHLQGGADTAEITRQLDLHIPADDLALAVQEDLESLNEALGVVDVRIGA